MVSSIHEGCRYEGLGKLFNPSSLLIPLSPFNLDPCILQCIWGWNSSWTTWVTAWPKRSTSHLGGRKNRCTENVAEGEHMCHHHTYIYIVYIYVQYVYIYNYILFYMYTYYIIYIYKDYVLDHVWLMKTNHLNMNWNSWTNKGKRGG